MIAVLPYLVIFWHPDFLFSPLPFFPCWDSLQDCQACRPMAAVLQMSCVSKTQDIGSSIGSVQMILSQGDLKHSSRASYKQSLPSLPPVINKPRPSSHGPHSGSSVQPAWSMKCYGDTKRASSCSANTQRKVKWCKALSNTIKAIDSFCASCLFLTHRFLNQWCSCAGLSRPVNFWG